LAGVVSSIAAISSYSWSKTSRSRKTARSSGDSVSSSTMKASVTDSASASDCSGSARSSVSTGSGSHGPTYSSRAARADFRRSRQSRVTIVVKYACGDRSSDGRAAE
jgi:hypothetical protein